MNALEHAVARGETMGLIQDCDRCALRTEARAPVPFRGPSPNQFMALGEAPGAEEDRHGKPFIGPSGRLLNTYLREAELPELDAWFVANVCCCRAHGAPELESIAACTPNLRAQLLLCNPEWVLALGATALAAIVPKTRITKIAGRPFYVPAGPFIGRWCFPTFHPAAALRDDRRANDLHANLATLSQIVRGVVDRTVIAARVGRGGKVFV